MIPPNQSAEEEETPEQPVGYSASLKGTVADPSPLNSDRLYVGQMRVGIAGLSKDRLIEFVLHCYNGSDNVLFVHRAGGSFEAAYTSKDGEGASLGEFSGAVISDALPVERIPPHEEFVISLEQRVTKDFADKILSLNAGGNVILNFAKFDISVGSHFDRKTLVRLPVWDGIRLSRDEGLNHGRVIHLGAKGIVTGSGDTD